MTPSSARAVDVGRRLEQHVDRRPREVHRLVDRQRELRPALDQQVVVGRREVDRARLDRLLVLGLAHRQRARGAEELGQQARPLARQVHARRRPARAAPPAAPAAAPTAPRRRRPRRRSRPRRCASRRGERRLMPRLASGRCARRAAELGEGVGVRREAQRSPWRRAEKALAAQRVAEQPERAVLQLAVEVDQHVAARDQLHLGEHAVGGQAVVGEHDVLRAATCRTPRAP